MNIIESLVSYLKGNKQISTTESPEGLCPNCWGREEYGGQFYEAVRNYRTSINDTNPSKGWIQDYAEKNLSGIQLKMENDQYACSKCKLNYKPS